MKISIAKYCSKRIKNICRIKTDTGTVKYEIERWDSDPAVKTFDVP